MSFHRVALALSIVFSIPMLVVAQPATAPSRMILGPKFQSLAAGVSFRPPVGLREFRGAVGTSEIVRFLDEDKKWIMKVSRVLLDPDKPLPLTEWKDKKGETRPGMLEFTVQQFKLDTPGAQVLRQDVINIGEFSVGMMAARFNFGLETNVAQQAILKDPNNNLQYFIFALTCPAPREGNVEADANVRSAVESFNAMLDTVQLVDQSMVKEDQEQRLFRTRTLFVNLTPQKLTRALQKQQWLRLIREGKDVGYMYVIEEIGRDLPRAGRPERQIGPEGVLIGVRTRTLPEGGVQTDSESWLYSSFDRKLENWSSVAITDEGTAKRISSGELGVTRWRTKPVADMAPGVGNNDRDNVRLTEEYRLEVTRLGRGLSSEPIVRDLPPFYLPLALGQLLPRLVPLNEPKGYLFATWVSDAGELVYRYVDVGYEREFTLGGRRVRAVPVKDHVGLEGSVTTHYISPEGKYLGSVNDDSRITILPTDAATLESHWKNANLTRPGAVQEK